MQRRHPDRGRSCILYQLTACSVTFERRGMLYLKKKTPYTQSYFDDPAVAMEGSADGIF